MPMRPANSMLDAGDILRSLHGRLGTRDRQVDKALQEIFAASDNGDAGVGVKGIALPLTAHDGERYVAHVLPLTSGERRRAAKAYTATAAMFVCRGDDAGSAGPGSHRQAVQPDADRAARASRHRRGRRHSRGRDGVRRRGTRRSGRMSADCSTRPASAGRPIWSSWSPDFPRRSRSDASSLRALRAAGPAPGEPRPTLRRMRSSAVLAAASARL